MAEEQAGADGASTAGREERASTACPVIALGASAGGLEALRQLFADLPAHEIDAGFVVIQHLDPERPSMLARVLAGVTSLPVVEATEGLRLEPRRVLVIPAEADLAIEGGVLSLVPRGRTGRLHLPIDAFFRALAADAKGRAIGVVLSGAGSDGTEGLRAIKAEGGLALAQSPSSAQFRDMPESAIASRARRARSRSSSGRSGATSRPRASSRGGRPRPATAETRTRSPTSSRRCTRSPGPISAATSAPRSCAVRRGAWPCATRARWPSTRSRCATTPRRRARSPATC
jgi:hypothetical protein